MRVRAAFSKDDARAMRSAVWHVLADVGIREHDPSTWTQERPAHLQAAKADPAFAAVGSARVLDAIGMALEGQAYETPKHWGAVFAAFPSKHEWNVPSRGWHIDANYWSALAPPAGIRTHTLFGDVAPRAGGTLIVSGSHRLVYAYFTQRPAPIGGRAADFRKHLQAHSYLRDLHADSEPDQRVGRFMARAETHDGIPLQVVEMTGAAGDVLLLHPLLLHVAAANNGRAPRFLLSGGIDLPSMWNARPERRSAGIG